VRYMLLAQLLLSSCAAFASDKPATCVIAGKSIVSHASTGLAQVSNLDGVQIRCSVPARPFPTKPGETRYALRVVTSAYKIIPGRGKKLVPSEVKQFGGGGDGFGPHPKPEWVGFFVLIPLEPAQRDAEARRYLAKMEKSMAPGLLTEEARMRGLKILRKVVYQQQLGHFQVECRVMDGGRLMGVGSVEFEVLFKGRFSDVGLFGAPPA
jgi:hypothetical protein